MGHLAGIGVHVAYPLACVPTCVQGGPSLGYVSVYNKEATSYSNTFHSASARSSADVHETNNDQCHSMVACCMLLVNAGL